MKKAKITVPEEMLKSIKEIVDKTHMFENEEDFINQAIIKQLSKFREV